MDRKSTIPLLLLHLLLGFQINSFSQTNGDFQTRNVTGNWSDYNSWNKYVGSIWIAATAGQLPVDTRSVYIKAGHTMTVDNALATCKDINLNGDDQSKISFSAVLSTLNVKGDMHLFSATQNCFGIWYNRR